MKPLDVLAASHLRHVLRERHATWFEAPAEPVTVGSLVATPPSVVAPTAPLAKVRRQLLTPGVPAVVVMDGPALAGVITPLDLVRTPAGMAIDAVSPGVQAVATTPIERAAAMMVRADAGTLVVTTHDGCVIGLVSALEVAHRIAAAA